MPTVKVHEYVGSDEYCRLCELPLKNETHGIFNNGAISAIKEEQDYIDTSMFLEDVDSSKEILSFFETWTNPEIVQVLSLEFAKYDIPKAASFTAGMYAGMKLMLSKISPPPF